MTMPWRNEFDVACAGAEVLRRKLVGAEHALDGAKADGKRMAAAVREMQKKNIQLRHDICLLEEKETSPPERAPAKFTLAPRLAAMK